MAEENDEKPMNFHEMELDDRLLKAVAKLGWQAPTLIQERAIPLLLEGKDVLVRARTGSGKTAAFSIPVIQKILNLKQTARHQEIKALILAPSKELCHQIAGVIKDLTIKCTQVIRCVDVSPPEELTVQKPLLVERPDIVIGTPTRVLKHIKAGYLDLKSSMEILVIDEADLVFSFGYEADMKEVLGCLPNIYQAILASATLSDDVKSLKSLVLHNPITLKLEEPDLAPASQLTHYHLMANENDKASILYTLLKLNLIRGKTIIFVNTVDKAYKLKLYLEQFAIPVCVLNSELPANIRCHSVSQFNRGIYDIIVASDEKSLDQPGDMKKYNSELKKTKRRKDKESGVSRGIDFQFVANVINFDFPLDIQSYIHRAGRTARGTNQGSVLSFVSLREKPLLELVEEYLKNGLEVESIFRSYHFKLDEVESFRYRSKDAWRSVTKVAIREARLKEIRQEAFNSKELKSYFEDNPTDLKVLRHDKALHTVKIQPHLANIADYMVPPTLQGMVGSSRKRKRNYAKTSQKANNKFQAKKSNPLLSMDFVGFGKKKRKIK